MSVLKMKSVTVVGRIEEFERVAAQYIDGREIHLENAVSVLKDKDQLTAYDDDTSYAAIAKNAREVLEAGGFSPQNGKNLEYDKSVIIEMLDCFADMISEERKERGELENEIEKNNEAIHQFENMQSIDVDLNKLNCMDFIKVRFGRIPRVGYKTLTTYLKNMEAIFLKTVENEADVYGFYFVPSGCEEKVDAVFASLYFERISLSEKISGAPSECILSLNRRNDELRARIAEIDSDLQNTISTVRHELDNIYATATERSRILKIRHYAAHSKEFFYIVGWMDAKASKKLNKDLENEPNVMLIENEAEEINASPPTKLKNNPIFRPFEMFVRMYGLPSYGEVDPTPILAVSYILLFGIMFGDVGQSAVFAILGFILYKVKKMDLAAMISMCGVAGIFTGFAYGSVFGNETLLENVRLIAPMEKLTFILMSAIALGVLIIVFCMTLNIINAVKEHNVGKALFSTNGAAGMIFYLSVIGMAVNMILSFGIPTGLFISLIAVSFIVMYLQEPLSHLAEGRKNWLPKEGMFYVESFFEMFDVVLSFASNTISFMRVGAFVIIHVGMMMAVEILAGHGSGAIVVKIIGNIVVMGLEGLIVGIQVLRLEYYEMFSRYYNGKGREFVSLRSGKEGN